MRIVAAVKAFFKVLRTPQAAEKLLDDKSSSQEGGDYAHLRLLGILQDKGRLVDFLKEDLSSFSDAQVGAAVRKVHQDCSKSIEDLVTLRPVMSEGEGSKVTVPKDYNPAEVKVVGNVKGGPPFEGILRHPGWKAHKLSLPKQVGNLEREIVAPAEVEVK
ncbi:MAG: DUF2760 domain-containing protein [Chlamydiota bacterium]